MRTSWHQSWCASQDKARHDPCNCQTEHYSAGIDNMLAVAFIDAWRDGSNVQTLVEATQNTNFPANVARYYDLWLSSMLGN